MLEWSFLLIVAIPIYALFLAAWISKKQSYKRVFWKSMLFWYFVGVIVMILFPLPVQKELIRDSIGNHFLQNNFVPFHSIIDIVSHATTVEILFQIGGNIILLVPFGFLLPALKTKYRDFSRIWFFGLLLTFGIELTQFIVSAILGFTYKITDIDDVILNFIGFLIGYGIWKITKRFLLEYHLVN